MLIRRSHIVIAGFSTVALGFFYYIGNHFLTASCWEGMRLSQTVANHEYCEFSNMNAFFRQSMNSYSNLFYFFGGMILLLTGITDARSGNNKNKVVRFPSLSILFGGSLIYLCLGSTFFHASLTWPGQRLDMNGTYSVTIISALLSIYYLLYQPERERTLKRIIVFSYFVLLGLFVYLHLLISSLLLLPFMLFLIIAATGVNYFHYKNFQLSYAGFSLICLIAALVLRQLDTAKIGCNPFSLWQGHAAWHVLTGLSAFLLYLFYRSEVATAI